MARKNKYARENPVEMPANFMRVNRVRKQAEGSSFWDKYKHPKWQQKRLEVMQSAGFACEKCDSKDDSLSVHHSYYERGLDPWDYPDDSLHCLCEKCHKGFDDLRRNINRQIGRLNLRQIEELFGCAIGLEMEDCLPSTAHTVDNLDVMRGIMRVFATLDRSELDGYVSAVLSVIGADGNINSQILRGAADEVRQLQELFRREAICIAEA